MIWLLSQSYCRDFSRPAKSARNLRTGVSIRTLVLSGLRIVNILRGGSLLSQSYLTCVCVKSVAGFFMRVCLQSLDPMT